MSESLITQENPCQSVACTPKQDVSVSATSPDQMAQAQAALIEWAQWKVKQATDDYSEANESFEYAKSQKWRSEPLQRMALKAKNRLTFFKEVLTALEQGYTIVPNFPVTAFAIRTDKNKPLRLLTTRWNEKHDQNPGILPQGEGDYENPFPLVLEKQEKPATATTGEVKSYWADSWKDFEFPVTMAKPQVMAAATRAMALKLFDDLAILPGYAPGEGTTPPRGDPISVARIYDKSRGTNPWCRRASEKYKYVTFMVAWHLNTRDL